MTRASTRRTSSSPRSIQLHALPGHCIRRLQQIAVAIERKDFMRMMQRVIAHHDELDRTDTPGS